LLLAKALSGNCDKVCANTASALARVLIRQRTLTQKP